MATYLDILNAVKAGIEGLAVSVGASVVVRKVPLYIADYDTTPLFVVSPLNEEVAGEQFENNVFLDYPVVVLYVQTIGSDPESQEQLLETLRVREEVRLAFWKTSLAGVDSVFDCSYDPDPPFDLSALSDTFDASLQLFTFRTSEARSS